MNGPELTEAEAIEQIVLRSQKVIFHDAPKNDGILVFPDKTVLRLEGYADKPRRKRAKVELCDQASFADYVNAHRSPKETAIFGCVDESGGRFEAILDYHIQTQHAADAGWGLHHASLDLAFTPEWKRWMEKNDKVMPQTVFADFIEDNVDDICDPSGADILEIAQDLTAHKDVNFRSGMRLKNGQQSLNYEETIVASGTKSNGQLVVPDKFTVIIAPFVGTEPQKIDARLRFRIDNGHLAFQFKLNRPHKVVESAFTAARVFIKEQTTLPVLLGSAIIPPLV